MATFHPTLTINTHTSSRKYRIYLVPVTFLGLNAMETGKNTVTAVGQRQPIYCIKNFTTVPDTKVFQKCMVGFLLLSYWEGVLKHLTDIEYKILKKVY